MNPAEVSDLYVQQVAFRRWGLSPKKTGSEWHSACPQCGRGVDRFMIFSNGGFYCRQCEYRGWLDDDQQKFRPDPLLMIQQAERLKLEREKRERRWQDWCNGFATGYFWREWHDQMSPGNREWYHLRGITDEQIDSYELGYMTDKKIKAHGVEITLPAYTVPIRDLNTLDIVNIHYRLVNPPLGTGKYRYESSIPAREFYAVPGVSDKAIVLEGAFKAMVVQRHIREYLDHQVIGLPGCTSSEAVLERLKLFDEIWLGLDPGCELQAKRFKKALPQTRIMSLTDKPDDAFLAGMSVATFKQYMALAR